MNTQSRIPKLDSSNFDGALMWFAEMQTRGLMFHPDDDPAEMLRVCDWQRMFSDPEVSEVRFVMNELFTNLGDEVYAAAYPIVMNAYGIRLNS